ncbi:MAG: TRAP transporter small permease [Chromatiales bacterium]|nr:TRAP transporter small permease [Chromatiales bacterium]
MLRAIDAVVRGLARFNDALMAVCRHLITFIVAALAVILIAAVVWRYGFDSAISWSEEACKYLMVWLAFLGTPIALRNFAHINIDLLAKAMPPRIQQLLHVVVSLIIVFTMTVVTWKGIGFTQLGMRQVASSFNLSMMYMYVAVPIGAGLTALVALEHALRALVGVADPARGLHDPGGDWAQDGPVA